MCVTWNAYCRRAAHVQFALILPKFERLELEVHPVRRLLSNEVRAVVIGARVLNDVVVERCVARVCLRHTHAVLHEQFGAIRGQLFGVQFHSHVERSTDGQVFSGGLYREAVVGVEEHFDI